ncbi:MAG: hypothetical protein A2139_07585 [Desulfobacca sp. RBG_16_60_12]|nr:MAG: hypothetical protein A2139_07585 [Desulfobacca sp. RBG_16_60_12]
MPNLDATIKVDASALLKLDLHDICVIAVCKMVEQGISQHITYVSGEDNITFGLKEGGRIPKVTIEWVDASEAEPPEIE